MPDRTCTVGPCEELALPRRQRCYEHHLDKQPPVVRIEAAKRRLALIPKDARRPRVKQSEWPAGKRWCSGCQTFRSSDLCSGSRCRDCAGIARHMSRLRNEFGIDDFTYQELLERQGGRCAICRQKPKTTRLAVDHDHKCCTAPPLCGLCTRGLLCSRCNHELLGAAHDDVEIVRNALRYLETPPFSGDWSLPPAELAAWREQYGDTDPAPF